MTGRRRGLVRLAFVAYALLLFGATHRPNLTIPLPGRPDLVVHATVFGVWAALLVACGFFGPALSGRNLAAVAAIAPLYAAFDEGTQAIPWVRRHAAWDDLLFNMAGIGAVLAAAAIFAALRRNQSTSGATMPTAGPSAARNPAAP